MNKPGSSPRVRGKRFERACGLAKLRLIPACAGKTKIPFLNRLSRTAHPRVCGENFDFIEDFLHFTGSSPRVRGKLRFYRGFSALHGLIPACAGKTRRTLEVTRTARAHPRVCGENKVATAAQPHFKGSSPRVRGKQ